MAKKKQAIPLEELTREELITKCYNQRKLIKDLQDAGKFLMRANKVYRAMVSQMNLPHKLKVCLDETMSLFDDVEQLKTQVKNLETENK
mgnify:CR=1 FL=1